VSESGNGSHKIAVLLEIENENHTPDRCFEGLSACYTLSVPADNIRDDADPYGTAARIYSAFVAHRERFANEGYETVALATHTWQEWRDTIGEAVQTPFADLVRSAGLRYVELPTEGCNAEFRSYLNREISPLNVG
jgi:hypothetical protein